MSTSATAHHDARALLAGLLPDQRLALLHLFSCRRCRGELERDLAELLRNELATLVTPRLAAARGFTEEELDAMFARTEAASRSADELAAMPADDARKAILADARFRDPLVATALLLDAERALGDPARSVRLGEAAFTILSAQDADPRGLNFDRLCRALWTIVRSRRLQGRLEHAEEAFRRALPFLGATPAASEGRATLLAGVAQVRWAERRLDEAAALFALAARIFSEAGERQGEAACRAQAGWILVEQLDPWRARAELALAHAHVDAELAPALAARIGLVLAWCNLAVGRLEQARERLAGARRLYDRAPGVGEEVLRSWWEARMAALDSEPERSGRADALLDSVRRRLLAEGSVGEAAQCSLDLLALRVEAGRVDAVSELGPDLLRAFVSEVRAAGQPEPAGGGTRSQGNGVSVAVALVWRPAEMIDWLAILAQQRPTELAPALAAARHYLSGLRTHPKGRGNLIPAVQDLADRLLVAARPERSLSAGAGRQRAAIQDSAGQ